MANATATGEAGGAISMVVGPAIEFWTSLPIYGKLALIIVAGGAGVAYAIYQNMEEDPELEASDWEDRMENMIKAPTEQNGAPINQLIIKQSNSAAKRTMGKVKKLEETTTRIEDNTSEDNEGKSITDKELELKDYESVTFSFIRGRKKLDRIINDFLYKIGAIFSNGSNSQAEYLDIGTKHLEFDDRGIIIKPDVHLFKKNGLWQVADSDDQERIYQLSFVATNQNYLESLQQHPEFYSDLNMNVSGKKNIMNQKSENMKDYKKSERTGERMEGMEE